MAFETVVVTEAVAPYLVLSVYTAWEGLCEYQESEAVRRTLSTLLHGPETKTGAANKIISKL
jgi:hypothetical protein